MEYLDQLVNYGALGVVLGAFLWGLLVAKPTHDRVISERDRAEAQRDKVLDKVLEDVAPALAQAAQAISAAEKVDDQILSVLTDVRRLLESRQP